jgi:adenylate cyclase
MAFYNRKVFEMHEIERKFLLKRPIDSIIIDYPDVKHIEIHQSYLSDSGKWTIRVRKTVLDGFTDHYLTLKRRVTDVSCVELETEIDWWLFEKMRTQSGATLKKTRYKFNHQGHVWELDQFLNPELRPLEIAEIEIKSESELFIKPDWLGEEVTHDKQYKNVRLVQRLESQSNV